jgi:hypothetical protein
MSGAMDTTAERCRHVHVPMSWTCGGQKQSRDVRGVEVGGEEFIAVSDTNLVLELYGVDVNALAANARRSGWRFGVVAGLALGVALSAAVVFALLAWWSR